MSNVKRQTILIQESDNTMPRPKNEQSGAEILGITADENDVLAGTEEVTQSRYSGVIDFTRPVKLLIDDGLECGLEIKQAKPGYTAAGFPKVSIMYQVIDGDPFNDEAFWDDLMFIPPMPPKKGTMWRVHAFCDAIKYTLPEGGVQGDQIHQWIKEFAESLLGEQLRAVIKIEVSTQINDKTGKPYEPRNQIKQFITAGERSLDDLFDTR